MTIQLHRVCPTCHFTLTDCPTCGVPVCRCTDRRFVDKMRSTGTRGETLAEMTILTGLKRHWR